MTAVGIDTRMLKRISKRPRSAWDVGPSEFEPEAHRPMLAGNQGNGRHGSPPKRDDDREGHYVYNLGENITPRYKILNKMGEGQLSSALMSTRFYNFIRSAA